MHGLNWDLVGQRLNLWTESVDYSNLQSTMQLTVSELICKLFYNVLYTF